jgi:hypothetical protein
LIFLILECRPIWNILYVLSFRFWHRLTRNIKYVFSLRLLIEEPKFKRVLWLILFAIKHRLMRQIIYVWFYEFIRLWLWSIPSIMLFLRFIRFWLRWFRNIMDVFFIGLLWFNLKFNRQIVDNISDGSTRFFKLLAIAPTLVRGLVNDTTHPFEDRILSSKDRIR